MAAARPVDTSVDREADIEVRFACRDWAFVHVAFESPVDLLRKLAAARLQSCPRCVGS